MVAMAGPFLEILNKGSVDELIKYIEFLKKGLAVYMLLTGVRNVEGLRGIPLVITGRTSEWLLRRGVNIDAYARR